MGISLVEAVIVLLGMLAILGGIVALVFFLVKMTSRRDQRETIDS